MNYKIKTEIDPKAYLDPDTYCPITYLNCKIGIIREAQQDGHGWSKTDIEDATRINRRNYERC